MEALERVQLTEELNTKLVQLMVEYRELFGPHIDPITEELCDHPTDPCPCVMPEGYTPTNWILVSNWTDFGDNAGTSTGEDWLDTTASLGSRRSQIIGLLMMACDGMRAITTSRR